MTFLKGTRCRARLIPPDIRSRRCKGVEQGSVCRLGCREGAQRLRRFVQFGIPKTIEHGGPSSITTVLSSGRGSSEIFREIRIRLAAVVLPPALAIPTAVRPKYPTSQTHRAYGGHGGMLVYISAGVMALISNRRVCSAQREVIGKECHSRNYARGESRVRACRVEILPTRLRSTVQTL